MKLPWFHTIADRLVTPAFLLASDGHLAGLNPPARRLPGAADASYFSELCDDQDDLARLLKFASRSSSPLPFAITLKGADGPTNWRCDGSAIVMDGVVYVFLHLRELELSSLRFAALNTQIERLHAEIAKRAELELQQTVLITREQQARAEAERSGQFKDEFLAAISHEMRTPLQAISGWVDILRSTPDDPAMVQRGLAVIERNVDREVRLTEDLVDTALVITGRMKLYPQPVDLALVIQHSIEDAQPNSEAKSQVIKVTAQADECVVRGDKARLQQVVTNLINNASTYTPEGGDIEVTLRRVGSHAEIIVKDSGSGIEQDLLPYVFDRFRRAEGGSTRRHGGLGLGLAIVRHLVELHGGVIMAHSDGKDRGSTFTVNLPLPEFTEGNDGESGVATADLDVESTSSTTRLAGLKILLVEDHGDFLNLLASVLRQQGAEVFAVDGSAKALEVFQTESIDVVISDIEMPGEDGFTLMRKLRDLEQGHDRAPVTAVAMSAHSIGEAKVQALRCGFQAFVSKPLKASKLIAKIVRLRQPADATAET